MIYTEPSAFGHVKTTGHNIKWDHSDIIVFNIDICVLFKLFYGLMFPMTVEASCFSA